MTVVPCLRLAEESGQDPETSRRSRRLEILQDQLLRANRRAAGPFSHPYATRGSLSILREQIRDVSRVADAVMLNAESASDLRFSQLCSDLKALLMAQQHWTDRLENQIWRLESQSSLMQRLRKLLLKRPPGSAELWALCEVIAGDTQALPTGLLLLPEPGHQLLLSNNTETSRVSWALEQARLAVFAAKTLLPDMEGAGIVAQSLHAASSHLLSATDLDHDASVFAQPQWQQRTAITGPTAEALQLMKVAGYFLTAVETLSQTAVPGIVPPAVPEFFSEITACIENNPDVSEPDITMARAIGRALGLAAAKPHASHLDDTSTDDAAIVLTHKLRWHDATSSNADSGRTSRPKRVPRPHFPGAGSLTTSLTVFSRED